MSAQCRLILRLRTYCGAAANRRVGPGGDISGLNLNERLDKTFIIELDRNFEISATYWITASI